MTDDAEDNKSTGPAVTDGAAAPAAPTVAPSARAPHVIALPKHLLERGRKVLVEGA